MRIKPVKKCLIGIGKNGELDILETDEDEEGMYQLSE